MLVQINERKFVNTDQMEWVSRNGNYTDIKTKDGTLMQIWDEDADLWMRITNATKQEQGK